MPPDIHHFERSTADENYSRVARWLHWTIALLVILNLLIGLFHDALGEVFGGIMAFHKATGLTILALTLVRIGWRLTHRPPPLPAHLPGWERAAAHAAHGIFYLLLLVMPLTGWIMSSAGKYPLTWYGLFDVPKFAVAKGQPIVGFSSGAHNVLGLLFVALVAVHIAAALRHHFILKDAVLKRMAGTA